MNTNEKKTRYSDDELEEFKILIEEKLTKGKEQLDFYLSQLADRTNGGDAKVRGLDDGTGTAEKEQLMTLAARQRKHLQHLENALLRVKNKVYGVCRETGNLISKERLLVVPHATLSIAAKQKK